MKCCSSGLFRCQKLWRNDPVWLKLHLKISPPIFDLRKIPSFPATEIEYSIDLCLWRHCIKGRGVTKNIWVCQEIMQVIIHVPCEKKKWKQDQMRTVLHSEVSWCRKMMGSVKGNSMCRCGLVCSCIGRQVYINRVRIQLQVPPSVSDKQQHIV